MDNDLVAESLVNNSVKNNCCTESEIFDSDSETFVSFALRLSSFH